IRRDRTEEARPVHGAEYLFYGAFGVRHHSQHVAFTVHDPGDVPGGAVRVGRLGDCPGSVTVPEDDATLRLQRVQLRSGSDVASFAVGDRNPQHLPLTILGGKGWRALLHPEVHRLRAELERSVPNQCSWQQAGLAENLEAVADADHEAAAVRELAYLAHDRAEARDRPGAQVVAVAEPAGEEDDIDPLQVVLPMPEVDRLRVEDVPGGLVTVVVTVRPREGDYTDLHLAPSRASVTRTSKSSVTGFASSCRHIATARSSASSALSASSSSWINLPTCTSPTPLYPRLFSAP